VGSDGAEILIANQLNGLEQAASYGITVKVNTVLIPDVNDAEIRVIAEEVKRRGASIMNVMPLIPQVEFATLSAPTSERLEEVRSANEAIIGQFRHCRQCRADAVGLIGIPFPMI
jgi:nitrogen fixation protein NifB